MAPSFQHQILMHSATMQKVEDYLLELKAGAIPGGLLEKDLSRIDIQESSPLDLVNLLMDTKLPQIFAESAVQGDGSDWSQAELSILGDISVAVPVSVFDDGRHRDPQIHETPFSATLLYTPGALLRGGRGLTPADWNEVVSDETIDQASYDALYERRLLPPLLYASHIVSEKDRQALVTIPGLGCGQFAGPFHGTLGSHLERAISSLLQKHSHKLEGIRAVYFDPYSECRNSRSEIGATSFLVRPLTENDESKSQLCRPEAYQEAGDDFSDCDLFSIVAWDHVSWPGNDFYIGSRATDDGVKAAATSSMHVLTGVEGQYDKSTNKYQPPTQYRCWRDVVESESVFLSAASDIVLTK